MKPLFLQKAIDVCEKMESGIIAANAFPYINPETNYIISVIEEPFGIEWNDCTINNQPNWLAFRPELELLTTLYLKNKISGQVYFLTV